jgi:small subunit ribosomal protein S2
MSTLAEKAVDRKEETLTDEQIQERLVEAKKLLKELVEAGVHLGHPTKEWNPKMAPYIYDAKDGVHIINLSKTVNNLMAAADFLKKQAKMGRNILFVGTSKQTSSIVKEQAERSEVFFINQRWLGGLITNFDTIRARLNKLRELELQKETGGFDKYGKKEIASFNRQITKLNSSLGGLKKMRGRPEVIVAFDQKKDAIAITEARKVNAKIVALTDTNCDPSNIDYVIPANDDSLRSIEIIAKYLADAVIAGSQGAKRR